MSTTSFPDSIVIKTMQEDSIDINLSQPSVLKNQLIQAQNTIDQLQQQVKTLQAQIKTQGQKLETMVKIITHIDEEITNLLSNSSFNTINFIQFQVIEKEKLTSSDKIITEIQTNFDLFLKQIDFHFPTRTIKKIQLQKSAHSGQKKLEKMADQQTESFYKGHKFSKTEPNQFFPKKN